MELIELDRIVLDGTVLAPLFVDKVEKPLEVGATRELELVRLVLRHAARLIDENDLLLQKRFEPVSGDLRSNGRVESVVRAKNPLVKIRLVQIGRLCAAVFVRSILLGDLEDADVIDEGGEVSPASLHGRQSVPLIARESRWLDQSGRRFRSLVVLDYRRAGSIRAGAAYSPQRSIRGPGPSGAAHGQRDGTDKRRREQDSTQASHLMILPATNRFPFRSSSGEAGHCS